MTTTRSLTVVLNPVTSEEKAADLRQALGRAGLDAVWTETTEDDPGTGQARRAVQDGADTVIVCGGDGTVRACIEGMHGTDAGLVVVPAGTGNLLAANLGIPEDAEEAVGVARGGGARRIDVGWVNGEAFAVMTGAGFDAEVMSSTSSDAKRRLGPVAYLAEGLRHLRDRPMWVDLRVDGRLVHGGPISTVLVANMGKIQGGIPLFPDADPTDGILDVMVVTARGIGDWLVALYEVLARRRTTRRIRRWTGRSIEAVFRRPVPYEMDGEERPATDRIEVTVDHASVLVVTRGVDA